MLSAWPVAQGEVYPPFVCLCRAGVLVFVLFILRGFSRPGFKLGLQSLWAEWPLEMYFISAPCDYWEVNEMDLCGTA